MAAAITSPPPPAPMSKVPVIYAYQRMVVPIRQRVVESSLLPDNGIVHIEKCQSSQGER